MKSKMTKNVFKAHTILLFLIVVAFVTVIPNMTMAKSLFVIADKGSLSDSTQPLHIYDIGSDGTLSLQAQHDIPHRVLGAVGMAIDSDNGYLFVTYHGSEEILVLDASSMTSVGKVTVSGAENLAGIVYDHDKMRVYCVDRGQELLYVYEWDPVTATLTDASHSPFILSTSSAYGIALDELDDLLYVANNNKYITVYETSNWQRVDRIKLDRAAISVAVDTQRGLLYTGAGYAGDNTLAQYNLSTGVIEEVQVESEAGVMGLSVNSETGVVYLSTGLDNKEGGDNLQAYDTQLNLIDLIHLDGDPTAVVVPLKDISFNPLGLQKTIVRGASNSGTSDEAPTVDVGDVVTYGITFNNYTGDKVTDVIVVDTLPSEVIFISADDDGVSGSYDAKTHSYTWTYASWPPEVSATLELTVQVDKDVETGTIISNTASIVSEQTPLTTKRLDVGVGHNPLNLSKIIQGGAQGQVTSVKADSTITYVIEFDNSNDFVVKNVVVQDVLPKEVSFVSAQSGTVAGKYDPETRTCTWTLASLKSGQTVHLEVEAQVDADLAKGKTFTNTVTVESDETPLTTAWADAIVSDTASSAPELKVLPEVIRRDDQTYNIQASIIFQEGAGIGTQHIADVLPTLYVGDGEGEIKANELLIFGTDTKAKVVALFDKSELLGAVKGYGVVPLKMVGMLTSGRSYSAEGVIRITRYSGVQ
ncbi:MAG: DUF11 domain-containing protein [Sedimentisphaerales bacterium]|nr:DUF11 domain-containing protein [Sedimentisphaerales bacterium]